MDHVDFVLRVPLPALIHEGRNDQSAHDHDQRQREDDREVWRRFQPRVPRRGSGSSPSLFHFVNVIGGGSFAKVFARKVRYSRREV